MTSADTPSEAVAILLHRLNTKFTNYSIRNLQQHPDYPSLLSINHTLNQLQIDNIALRATYEQLQHELPKPLLVHTQEDGGTYRVVDNLDEEQVYFVDKKGKLQAQAKEAFLKSWNGVAMLVDEQTKGIEQDYALNRARDFLDGAKLPLATLGLLLLVGYVFFYTNHLSSGFDYLFLLTKALGVTMTIPLMIRLVDKQNPFVNKLCHSSKAGGKTDCSSILDSPAARVLGVLTWSEVGFLYFTTLFFYLLLFKAHANVLVAALAVLAAPYTVYSLYYQWKVARQWCRLCLAVQAVLLLELALAIAYFSNVGINPVSWPSILVLVLIAVVMVSAYGLLKPVLVGWKSYQQQLPRLNRIKYKPAVFQALLKEKAPMDMAGVTPIQLANPEGEHQITIVSNPKCGPCVKMHQKLSGILKNKENVSVQEIFLTSDNKDSIAYRIATNMLRLHQSADIQIAKEAIAAYYEEYSSDDEGWLQKYDQVKEDNAKAEQTLEQHIAWCRKKEISATPLVLYNGYRLPQEYSVEDLDYLLD